ncbi:MAG: hypothetical protein ACT4OX_04180 [Actinomycetota bacterium]
MNVVETSTSLLTVQVQRSGGAQSLELSPTLTSASDIHIELNVGSFDPGVLTFAGSVQAFTPAIVAGTGNTVTLDVSPGSSTWLVGGCTATSCGGPTTRADLEFAAIAAGAIHTPPSQPSTGPSIASADFRGTWIEGDAQAFGAPTFAAVSDTFAFSVGSPHLHADGSVNDDGFLRLFLPDAFLRNGFGITNGASMTSESLNITCADRSSEVADVVARLTGGNTLTVPVLDYSVVQFSVASPTIGASEPPSIALDATPSGNGYWIADNVGNVFPFGDANLFGSMAGTTLNGPVIDFSSTPNGAGYWMVGTDGGIFNFGNAGFFGSMGGVRLNQPVVGMAATVGGAGYWQVASDGGVFSFAGARFFGSMGGLRLNQPVVGMAPTPTGNGYWLVASDGGVFSFGDATFFGSMGSVRLNQSVVGMVATASGNGYMLVARDGGLFAFGDAVFRGSMGGRTLRQPVVGMDNTPDGAGYWEVASDGGLFNFGSAAFFGSHAP